MGKYLISILITLTLLSFSTAVKAQPIDVTVSGTELTVGYVEPSFNNDIPPTPLTDLAFTSVYIQSPFGPAVIQDLAATSPTGGGSVVQKIVIPLSLIPNNAVTILDIWASATDTTGNEGPDSDIVFKEIDKLPPGKIQ